MMSKKYIQPSLFPEEELHENISSEKKEYDLTNLFEGLAKSDFRSRFHLSKKDREYVMEKGLPTIRRHAEDFVAKRLAPALIPNDGKQTPMRGHPVFLAQPTTSREQSQSSLWLCRGAKEEDEVNMPLAAVVEVAFSSGIISRQAGH